MGEVEHLVQSGLADVKPHNYYLFAHKGKAAGQVAGIEALSLAGCGGGEKNYFLSFLKHVLDIGTHRAEHFFHQFVAVFVHHNGTFSGFRSEWNIAYDRQVGNLFYITAGLDFELKQAPKENQAYRKT